MASLKLFPRMFLPIVGVCLWLLPLSARDWIHWRGPEQNGLSREKNLPGEFDPAQGVSGNVLWKQPYGGRSAPLIMAGRLYIIQGTGEGLYEGEQVVCFEEKSGKKLWEYRVNVYHTDIVSSRLGWTTLTADPVQQYIYAHTTAGELLCLDSNGKLVWRRQLTEEFGRVTGYGGRIVTPIFDSGLVIVGMPNASWGDQARGLNRYVAFDGQTGQVVWWSTLSPDTLYGTYYSSPVIAVINGQRLLITGGADGALHALKVRTGELVWSIPFAKGVINGSPVVSGNLVICTHGEENPEGAPIGRIICVDASQVDPQTRRPKVVWDTFRRPYKANRNQPLANRFGLASAALADGLLYAPDDSGEIFCFRVKDGELLWRYRYATEVRGSPLIADGKLYIFDVKGRMVILTLRGEQRPDDEETFIYRFAGPGGTLNETNGTPVAVNGRLYFTTRTDLYCIGYPNATGECDPYQPLPPETPYQAAAVAGVRLFPADVTLPPGGKIQFQVVFYDANGRTVPAPAGKASWRLPLPPKTPTGAQPPALQGTVDEQGTLTVGPQPSQQGYVEYQLGPYTARARVRVAPQIPYQQDFEKVPENAVPAGWVNTAGKFFVKKLADGNQVLAKVNTDSRPPIARANAYITQPDVSNYTIEADVLGTLVRDKMPDIGLVNCRYTLILDGKTDPELRQRTLRITSWEARPRINHSIAFDWEPNTWYSVKLTVRQHAEKAVIRAKVWKKGTPEPRSWTISFEDPNPNRQGAAALYGYVSNIAPQADGPPLPGSEIYFDNVRITPNSTTDKE
jgi:outer membrane protein assembly factor BamB